MDKIALGISILNGELKAASIGQGSGMDTWETAGLSDNFAGVGVVSTLGYLFLFIAWRPLFGAFGANAIAMAIATLFNTAVHRELSRTADGQARRGRLFAVASGLFLVSLGLTTLGLVVAQWIAPGALVAQLTALTVANLIAAVFRFAVLRAWIFRPIARPGAGSMEVAQ